jgi:hypothetical protein
MQVNITGTIADDPRRVTLEGLTIKEAALLTRLLGQMCGSDLYETYSALDDALNDANVEWDEVTGDSWSSSGYDLRCPAL